MTFDNFWGYILSISICMQSFITIVHSARPFSLFQNLEICTASIDVKCHFAIFGPDLAILLSRSCHYHCVCKIYQTIPKGSRDRARLFFSEFEPLQNLDLSQILFDNLIGYILFNINVYAKLHHNILHSSIDRAILIFSEFGARQSFDRLSFRNLLG